VADVRTNKGVVLAAGAGTRLERTFDLPKPLIELGGVPLIFHTIETLLQGGVERLCVVLGSRAREVQEVLEKFAASRRVDLVCTYNERWREPNGLSVAAARSFTGDDDFILSMCDHLLDPGIVEVVQRSPHRDGAVLAVDEKIDQILDLDDATKVVCEADHRIVQIGKQLTTYNAVDCGVFCCSPEVHDALQQAFGQGGHSISAGMQVLAERGHFYGAPIGDCYWQDIDTPEMFRAAEQLVAGYQPWAQASLRSLRS
jgi:choline kinase